MSIRKLSQVFLSLSFVFSAMFCSTASAQDVSSGTMPFVPSRVTQRVDEAQRVTLHGNVNPLAKPRFDQGRVEPELPMNKMILVLKRSPEQEAALTAFNARQLDPVSPDFHHWLHAEEFGQTYGPSDADMATVTGWLERQGFHIDDVAKGRVNIKFSGTAAQVEQAFHVEMHHYLVAGKMHLANDRDPQIPAALSPVVAGIASLHNFFGEHIHHEGKYVTRDPKTGKLTRVYPETGTQPAPDPTPLLESLAKQDGKNSVPELIATPQLTYTDANSEIHEDLAPADFAAVYNMNPAFNAGITGKGVTVAITATSDITKNDINVYRSTFGLPATTVNYIQTDAATDPGVTDPGENTEDLDMVSAAAPGATLDLVISNFTATTSGYELSDEYTIDNELAPIMTVSYGECELMIGTAGNTNLNQVFQQGATEGISIFVAAGDSGAATCERQELTPPAGDVYGDQVSGYAASPYVTAVGGTDFAWSYGTSLGPYTNFWNATNGTNDATAKGYIPEIAWNTTCANPLLLKYFVTGTTPQFASTEALCNAAITSTGYVNLVTLSAGGGGYSHCTTSNTTSTTTNYDPTSCSGGYAKPSWQKGTGVPADGKRDVPDISMFGSYGYDNLPSGYGIDSTTILVCITNPNIPATCSSADYTNPSQIVFQENGGTSAASPFSAGVMALVLQKTGSAQGLANPVFYSLAAKQSTTACNSSTEVAGNTCYFNDVTAGSNAQVCITGGPNCITNTAGDQAGIMDGYSAGAGYDQATGLGTMNVTNIVNGWPTTAQTATLSFTPTSLTFASTAIGTTAASQSVTVKNTGTAAVTFNSIALTGSTDFGNLTTTCPSPLAAGATCTVSVNFKPVAAGAVAGAISFADSATGSPQTVALSGTGAAAALTVTVSPTALTFASTTVGSTTAAQVVTVKNTSVSAVTLGTIGFTGTGATSYVESATTCTTSLAASASCTISVEFKPTATGSLPASLSIADNATGAPQLVTITGTGVAAPLTVTVSPTSLAFASTTVGSTTAAQVVTVKNTSVSAVTLGTIGFTGTGATSYLKSATTCTTSLAAAASCTISVEFKPTVAGALPASLSIADNATGTPQFVAITGTGVAAPLTVTVAPTALTFASTTVGSTTAAQVVTVKNTSVSAVTLGTIGFTGTGATSYLKSATTCTTSLAAAASCTISVEFKPTVAGALPASLSIADNATGTPQLVALTGTGVAAPLTATVAPTVLTFASTTVGSTTAAQVVTVKNTSVSAVTLGTIGFTGTGATSYLKSATTCTTSLAAAASCTISVEFKPTVAGALPASLSIADNATGTPQLVALTGTGVAPGALGLSVTSLAFPATVVGSTSDLQIVTLTNPGTIAATISSIAITGTNATSFVQLHTCGATLAPAASCTFYVSFKPTAAGALSGTLTITDNATGSPQKVTLTGTGTAVPVLKLSATTLAFGTVKVGSSSAIQVLTLTNSGAAVVELDSITLGGTNPTSFLALNTCGATLTAGATCSVYVGFTPTVTGSLTGTLSIVSNGSGSPQTVAFTGTGN
jgi:hypothetical protein